MTARQSSFHLRAFACKARGARLYHQLPRLSLLLTAACLIALGVDPVDARDCGTALATGVAPASLDAAARLCGRSQSTDSKDEVHASSFVSDTAETPPTEARDADAGTPDATSGVWPTTTPETLPTTTPSVAKTSTSISTAPATVAPTPTGTTATPTPTPTPTHTPDTHVYDAASVRLLRLKLYGYKKLKGLAGLVVKAKTDFCYSVAACYLNKTTSFSWSRVSSSARSLDLNDTGAKFSVADIGDPNGTDSVTDLSNFHFNNKMVSFVVRNKKAVIKGQAGACPSIVSGSGSSDGGGADAGTPDATSDGLPRTTAR